MGLLALIAPRITPVLDPGFRPAVLANRAFREQVRAADGPVPVRLALEQSDGNVSQFTTLVLPETSPAARGNFLYLERIAKFLLWSRGGFRLYFDGPEALAAELDAYYRETPAGKFDSTIVAQRMFDHPLEVVHTKNLPPERSRSYALQTFPRSDTAPLHRAGTWTAAGSGSILAAATGRSRP